MIRVEAQMKRDDKSSNMHASSVFDENLKKRFPSPNFSLCPYVYAKLCQCQYQCQIKCDQNEFVSTFLYSVRKKINKKKKLSFYLHEMDE